MCCEILGVPSPPPELIRQGCVGSDRPPIGIIGASAAHFRVCCHVLVVTMLKLSIACKKKKGDPETRPAHVVVLYHSVDALPLAPLPDHDDYEAHVGSVSERPKTGVRTS